MDKKAPRFLDCGEAALSVEFGDEVDPAINARVLTLDARLRAAPPQGLRETTPTYRALLLRYEPLEISRDALVAAIEGLLAPVDTEAETVAARRALDNSLLLRPCVRGGYR